MLVYAHRGLHQDAPENSLGAIEAAFVAGFDGVEVDVRRCLTGELVLAHDPCVNGIPVSGQPLDGLSDGDSGIPTLLDAATLCGRLGLGLDIELKEPGTADEAIGTAIGLVSSLYVTSFLGCELRDAGRLMPRGCLGRLIFPDGSARSWAAALGLMAASPLSPAGLICPPFSVWARMPLAFSAPRSVVWCPPPGPDSISVLRRSGVAIAISDHPEHVAG